MAEEDGFLSRWSKRKRAVAEEARVAPAVPAVPEPSEAEPEPEFDLSALPALEDLTGASDMSVFLQKGVPEALKNAALRRAWALDPFIRDHIGPVECGWDFNDPNAMLGFGPLEESVDRAEMLRQILEGARREPAAEAAGADDVQLEPAGARDSVALDAGNVAESPDASPGAENEAGADAVAQNDPPVFIDEISSRPRKRRHGGAVPG